MKLSLLTLLITVLLCSCQKSYTLNISKDVRSALGGTDKTNEAIKFKADDDYAAYGQGAQKYISEQVADSLMNYEVERVLSFIVYDNDGNDLRVKLGLKATDSIDRDYARLKIQAAKSMGETMRKIKKSN